MTNLYGGQFANDSYTGYVANSEANQQALTLLRDTKGIEFDDAINGQEEAALFYHESLKMSFCWSLAQQLAETVDEPTEEGGEPGGASGGQGPVNGQTIEFMAFPTDPEISQPRLQGDIWGFGVFDNGDENKIAASKTFINFMANSDETAKAVKTSTYFSVKNSLSDLYKDDEVMNEYQKLMPYLGDYYQVTPGWAEARTAWWNMLQQVGQGTDVTTAVTEFCNTANAAASAS